MSVLPAQRILDLREQLTECAFQYYVTNSPTISDQEYDARFRELLSLEKNHPEMFDPNSPTMRVGSSVPNALALVAHKVRMLSLDNLADIYETLKFFKDFANQEITMEMKIDGLSLHLSYVKGRLDRAVTRGDGKKGEDVTENARTIHTIPLILRKPVTIDVRGEIYWRLSSFQRYNRTLPEIQRYSNPRNGAAGIMRQKDSQAVAPCGLDFVAYSIPGDVPKTVETQEDLLAYLESLGFLSTMTLAVTKEVSGQPFITTIVEPNHLNTAIEFLDNYRKSLDLDTDGLVLKISSLATQRDVGEGERAPHWGAAYKFPPESKSTKLLSVTVHVGKTGQITPVAQLEPVNLGGAMVQYASLCNQDELNRLGIDVGDYVMVQRAGEVIPKVVALDRPSPVKEDVNKSYQLPKLCPCCKSQLQRLEEKVHLFCKNLDCHDQILARLTYATGKDALDIDGCGEKSVQTLIMQGGVKRLSDLFEFKNWSIFKTAQRKKVQEGVELAKQAPMWRKLAAMNIESIGKVSSQDLCIKFDCILSMYSDPETMKNVVGKVATDIFCKWVDENIDELDRLAGLGFHIREDRKTAGPLSGKAFCITGGLSTGSRPDISALIESKGGAVKGTVTKKVDFLIQGGGGGNNKAEDAAKWGTRIIREEELYRMIGMAMPKITHVTNGEEL